MKILNKKIDSAVLYRSVLAFLFLTLSIVGMDFMKQTKDLEEVSGAIGYISEINAQAQRLVRMEVTREHSDNLILSIDEMVVNLGEIEHLIVGEGQNKTDSFTLVDESWTALKEDIYLAREEGYTATRILYTAETMYYATDRLLSELMQYFNYFPYLFTTLQYLIGGIAVLILISIAIRCVYYVSVIGNQKEAVEKSYIDANTGLYNRNKCQKLLSASQLNTQRAKLMIYDLNDLKVVNDSFGHSAGDELITSMANALKVAKEQNDEMPFIGRYGGDEFIVYFERASIEDVEQFRECVDQAVEQYNQSEDRFKVSYAKGHACSSELEEKTMSELFNLADERMYQNKKDIKKMN